MKATALLGLLQELTPDLSANARVEVYRYGQPVSLEIKDAWLDPSGHLVIEAEHDQDE